jgi:hypothetical protein
MEEITPEEILEQYQQPQPERQDDDAVEGE